MENDKKTDSLFSAGFVVLIIVWFVGGAVGLGLMGVILYGIARIFFRVAFDVDLPNPLK